MTIRIAIVTMVFIAALTGCSTTAPAPETETEPNIDAQIYATVVHQLVAVDHTFGSRTSPFQYVYVIDGVTPRSRELSFAPESRRFSKKLQSEIIALSEELPPVEFISKLADKGDLRRQGVTSVENDGVIVGLGRIETQTDSKVHVGAGLWCGGLCGAGLTYVVEKVDDKWKVTGNIGDHSIS